MKSGWAPDEPAPTRATPKGIYDQTCRTIRSATSNPYLLHAKVFIFTDYWGVPGLKEVSLCKLSSALQDVGLLVNTKCMRDRLIALVEYCYDKPQPEELLSLIHLYATFKLPQL
ncbi:hypothetical protein B0T14DRAFT_576464 [Immersiella caudata]|uniref:Uncharacterized protein n=1 Tax=Immersiella caudata TaxID=314043 RepID=A0AA39XHM4_9PEZI|nr:hypothetical protein B0T14DRAFT_576464 [Immersiella caudata]